MNPELMAALAAHAALGGPPNGQHTIQVQPPQGGGSEQQPISILKQMIQLAQR